MERLRKILNAPDKAGSKILLYGGLALVTFLCAVSYFRVLITDAGYQSVGRVWYYFRNYWDFGFAPTTLIGTILDPFISFPVEDPHRFAWQFLGIALIAFFIVFLTTVRYYVVEKSFVWALVLLISPIFLPHYFYNLGNLDVFIALLGIASIIFIDNLVALAVICLIGTATHSLFLFSFFPLYVALYFDKYGMSSRMLSLTGTLLLICAIFFVVMGSSVTPTEYAALMNERAPGLERDGSFEMFASFSESFDVTWNERIKYGFPYLWFTVVSVYVGGLIYFALRAEMKLAPKLLLVAAFVAPSFLTFLVTDIYRWLSMSAFTVFLYIVYLSRNSTREHNLLSETNGARKPVLFAATMLPWILLGPVGATCFGNCGATAFPLLKRLLDTI